MTTLDKLISPAHLIDMEDIIREGHPTLRQVAQEVALPLSDQDILLGEKMLQFLKHSQDPVISEKMKLRGGVGLAAPQLDVSRRIIALLVPNPEDEEGNPPAEAYALREVMYNPKILSYSVQEAAVEGGEGCLSVDREVPGYVPRHARITVSYIDKNGLTQKRKFKGFEAIVIQHEIDHINGIMFYDRIDPNNPLALKEGTLLV